MLKETKHGYVKNGIDYRKGYYDFRLPVESPVGKFAFADAGDMTASEYILNVMRDRMSRKQKAAKRKAAAKN